MLVVKKPDLSNVTARHTIVPILYPSTSFKEKLQLELELMQFSVFVFTHLALLLTVLQGQRGKQNKIRNNAAVDFRVGFLTSRAGETYL